MDLRDELIGFAGDNRATAKPTLHGEAAVKFYDELVKSPEDRLALEKEIPFLVAARDKAVTAAKRDQLQKETAAQISGHVGKMHR